MLMEEEEPELILVTSLLIGMIDYSYQQGACSFLAAHPQEPQSYVIGSEQFEDG